METKSLLFLLLAGGLCSAHLVASMITCRKTRSWHDMRMNVFKTVFFLKLAVVLFYGVSNRENIYLAWSTDVLLGLACLYFLCVAVSGLRKTRSWYIVRKDVNAALYGIALFLMAGPLVAMPEDEIVRHIVLVVAFVSFFGLVGLWDLFVGYFYQTRRHGRDVPRFGVCICIVRMYVDIYLQRNNSGNVSLMIFP